MYSAVCTVQYSQWPVQCRQPGPPRHSVHTGVSPAAVGAQSGDDHRSDQRTHAQQGRHKARADQIKRILFNPIVFFFQSIFRQDYPLSSLVVIIDINLIFVSVKSSKKIIHNFLPMSAVTGK